MAETMKWSILLRCLPFAVAIFQTACGDSYQPALLTGATPGAATKQRYLYVSGTASASISGFAMAVDGTLVPVPGSPFVTGTTPFAVDVSPDGRHVYVPNSRSSDISAYTIGGDGALAPVPGSPFAVIPVPGSPTIKGSPFGLAFTPDSRFLYTGNNNPALGGINAFAIAPDGVLTQLAGSPFATGEPGGAGFVGVSPNGRHLFATSYFSGGIVTLDIGPDGVLSRQGPLVATERLPYFPTITPDGRYMYIANEGSLSISAYSIGMDDGALTPIAGSPFVTGRVLHGTVVTPDGRYLYAINTADNGVSAYAVGANGVITLVPGSPFPAGSSPGSAAVTPNGRLLYVTELGSSGAGRVLRFEIGANGALTEIAGPHAATGVRTADGQATTITPDQGCARRVFNGQTALCNAGP